MSKPSNVKKNANVTKAIYEADVPHVKNLLWKGCMHAMIFFLLTQTPRDIFYTLELTEYMQITSSKIL